MFREAELPISLGNGGYRLTRILGQGGMATVYEAEVDLRHFDFALVIAHHEALKGDSRREREAWRAQRLAGWRQRDRKDLEQIARQYQLPYPDDGRAAVKVMLPQIDQVDRFRAEWESLLALSHPNLVRVYGGGVDAEHGCHFYTMELLDNFLSNKQVRDLPLIQRLSVIKQAAMGLECLHGQGIIHRDIKPSNIVCVRLAGGQVRAKVADLGIAKDVSRTHQLTLTDQVMGTPYYMAPEQAAGAAQVTALSDVYALGATLYYLVCGKAPYDGHSLYEVLGKLARGQPPDKPSDISRGHCPQQLAVLIERMMAMDPARRPPGMVYIVQAIDKFLERHGETIGKAQSVHDLPLNITMNTAERREMDDLLGGPLPRELPSVWLVVACLAIVVTLVGLAVGPLRPYVFDVPAVVDNGGGDAGPTTAGDGSGSPVIPVVPDGFDGELRIALVRALEKASADDFDGARKTLGALTDAAAEADKTDALAAALQRVDDVRTRRLTELAGRVGAALKNDDLAAADRALAKLKRIAPDDERLAELDRQIAQARKDASASDAIRKQLRAFDDALALARSDALRKAARDDYAGALAVLAVLRKQAEPLGRTEALDAAVAAVEARRTRRLDELVADIRKAATGNRAAARAQLAVLRSLAPKDARIATLERALEVADFDASLAELRAAAEKQVAADDFDTPLKRLTVLRSDAEKLGRLDPVVALEKDLLARRAALLKTLAAAIDKALPADPAAASAALARMRKAAPRDPRIAGLQKRIAAVQGTAQLLRARAAFDDKLRLARKAARDRAALDDFAGAARALDLGAEATRVGRAKELAAAQAEVARLKEARLTALTGTVKSNLPANLPAARRALALFARIAPDDPRRKALAGMIDRVDANRAALAAIGKQIDSGDLAGARRALESARDASTRSGLTAEWRALETRARLRLSTAMLALLAKINAALADGSGKPTLRALAVEVASFEQACVEARTLSTDAGRQALSRDLARLTDGRDRIRKKLAESSATTPTLPGIWKLSTPQGTVYRHVKLRRGRYHFADIAPSYKRIGELHLRGDKLYVDTHYPRSMAGRKQFTFTLTATGWTIQKAGAAAVVFQRSGKEPDEANFRRWDIRDGRLVWIKDD